MTCSIDNCSTTAILVLELLANRRCGCILAALSITKVGRDISKYGQEGKGIGQRPDNILSKDADYAIIAILI